MDILEQIIAKKRQRLAETKQRIPLEKVLPPGFDVRKASKSHALRAALRHEGTNIIAEFKRRSPSKGIIREAADLSSIVRSYQAGEACAVSVLTEEDYFDGSLADLRAAKESVGLPLLRKDFVFEQYQIYEAAVAGADAVLLIAAVLDDRMLRLLRRLVEEVLGMDALIEVHDAQEMDRAVQCGARIIGVNNRNLRTFEVSLETSLRLAELAPRGTLLVSESGLNNADDLRRLKEHGFNGFLIGEFLMRAPQPEAMLRELRG